MTYTAEQIKAAIIVCGFGVLSAHDVLEELENPTPLVIPEGVFYSSKYHNFVNASGRGCGEQFYCEWRDYRDKFPAYVDTV